MQNTPRKFTCTCNLGSFRHVGYIYTQNSGGRQLPNGFGFPCKFTNINHRSDKYKDFCDRFSRIVAEKSAGTVYFVAPWNTGIDDRRVWKQIEYNALANNAAVVKIVQVNYKDFLSEERPMSPPKQFDA